LISPDRCLSKATHVMKINGSAAVSIPNDRILEIGGRFAYTMGIVLGKISEKMKYE